MELFEEYLKQRSRIIRDYKTLESDKHSRILAILPRRSGKTHMLIDRVIEYTLENEMQDMCIIAPSDGQCSYLHNECLRELNNHNIKVVGSFRKNIVTSNGCSIKFTTTLRNEIRVSIDHMFVDEAGYMSSNMKEYMNYFLKTDGTLYVTGTPPPSIEFKQTLMGYIYHCEPLKQWHKYHILSKDLPHPIKSMRDGLLLMRNLIPDDTFRREYLGEFGGETNGILYESNGIEFHY